MRFVKDLGPTPQTFARDKLQKWKADEAFKRQIATAHLEPRTRKYEIPNVTSGHNGFPAALSLDFHKNSTRSQNFGRKVNILCDKLDARKASTLGILNINNTLRGGFVQAGNKMENIGVYGGKLVQGIGDGVVSFKQSMADQGIGTPYLSTIWNNSGNLIPNPINKGKNVLKAEPSSSVFKEIPGNNRKLVPLIKEGYNSCKDNPSYEDIGKYFSTSPAGNSVPSLSTTRDTHNIWEKVFLTPINPSKNFQMSEVTSSYPLQDPGDLQRNPFQPVREEGNAFTQNLPDQGVENFYLYPSLLGAGNSYFSNAENTLYNTNNFVPSAINMGVNVQIPRALREPAAVFKELMPNQGIGGNYFSTPLLLDGNSCFPVQPNSASNPGIFVPTIINNGAMNVQIPGMTSSGPSMLDTLLARDCGILPSATMEALFPAVTAGSDLTSLVGRVNQIQAGGGTSNEGKLEQADQTLSWLQPTQWAAPQPIFNVSMQEQSGMAAADLVVQAASSDWQALGNNTATNTANGQLMADTSVMNWRHSIDGHLEESNTGAPLFNNHKQTER